VKRKSCDSKWSCVIWASVAVFAGKFWRKPRRNSGEPALGVLNDDLQNSKHVCSREIFSVRLSVSVYRQFARIPACLLLHVTRKLNKSPVKGHLLCWPSWDGLNWRSFLLWRSAKWVVTSQPLQWRAASNPERYRYYSVQNKQTGHYDLEIYDTALHEYCTHAAEI